MRDERAEIKSYVKRRVTKKNTDRTKDRDETSEVQES